VIDTRCFENGHIKNEAFTMLEHGKLEVADRLSLAAHLASCNVCSENYTTFLLKGSLMDIPVGLNELIISKTIGSLNKEKSIKASIIQLFKLTAAAVLAVSLYSTGVFNTFYYASDKLSNNIALTDRFLQINNNSFEERLNEGLTDFSEKINKFNGVESYEKK